MRLDPPVGEALRAALGAPIVVRRLSSSPRSRVWLAEFDGSPAIIKQVTGGADAGALPAWSGPNRDDARAFTRLATRLGVPVPASVTVALDGLVECISVRTAALWLSV